MMNYFNSADVVAFSRGDVAFFAMAKAGRINQDLQTGNQIIWVLRFSYTIPFNFNGWLNELNEGLPAGTYCNIIDDCKTSVHVSPDGIAHVRLDNYEDPVLAIYIGYDKNPSSRQKRGKLSISLKMS